ncbi:hypothetical protein FACS1894216_02510 [Synergistales bacterium]|nr:hypothetical protein FACS1894216_02510 [Synergistales bacterium]
MWETDTKKFWTIQRNKTRNSAENEENIGEVLIYGDIYEGAWDDTVSPKAFHEELKALGDISRLHVRINSYGGHISAGMAIYSLLKQQTARVTVHIDGFALSAASVVAMAGDTVIMPGNAMMMIHNPWNITMGDSNVFRKEADVLDKMREAMIAAYTDKTGLGHDELVAMLDAETWLTAKEAVELGFADIEEAPILAAARVEKGVYSFGGRAFDLSKYRNPPEALIKKTETEENALTLNDKEPAKNAVPAPQAKAPDEEITAAHAKGKEEGIAEERARHKAIDELAVIGTEDVIAKAKYETGASAETVAVEIVRAQKKMGMSSLADRKEDAEASGVNNVTAAMTGDGIGTGDSAESAAKALNTEMKKRRGIA